MIGIRKLTTVALLGPLAALSACGPTGAEITQSDLRVSATSDARDRVVGQAPMVVRTYVADDAGKKQEVTGALCTFKSRDIAAKVSTPRRLLLPTYIQGARFADRGAPGRVAVTCTADGRKGTGVIEPLPFGASSNQSSTSNTYSGGTQLSVKTTTLSRRMASANPWTYGSAVEIVLK